MKKLEDVGVLVARILMPILFITAGWGKITGYAGTQQYMEAMGVPGFMLPLVMGPLAGKMLGSMFWFFEYRFTILPVLLTIPVFLLLGWLIPCMMYDNATKCSVVEQLRDAQ